MDSLPQLYLNGTALKGYDYEIQMNIDAEHLYDLVVKGELCPRNENGEYLLKEPQISLIELELCLQVIPNKKMFIKNEDGSVESVTHYCEEGVIDFKAHNNSIDLSTGKRISHARQIKPCAAHPNSYIYEHCRSKVISWLREQLYSLPIHHEIGRDCEMEFVELRIKGKTQMRPIVCRFKEADGTIKAISLLGCRLPNEPGNDPMIPDEFWEKMGFAFNANKEAVTFPSRGSTVDKDRECATDVAYDKIHDQLINMPESPPYHWNGKIYREDFIAYLEKNIVTGKIHKTRALSKWKSLKNEVGKERIGTGRKP